MPTINVIPYGMLLSDAMSIPLYMPKVVLNHEGLSATTGALRVGVLEDESGGKLVVNPVHLGADDGEKGL